MDRSILRQQGSAQVHESMTNETLLFTIQRLTLHSFQIGNEQACMYRIGASSAKAAGLIGALHTTVNAKYPLFEFQHFQ